MAGGAPVFAQESLPTPPPPSPQDEWSAKLTQSGGIMGLMRSVELSSDSRFTITDGRANGIVTGELDQGRLSELHEIVETSQFISGAPSAVCADCFNYEIEIRSGGRNLTAQADDIALPGSGMGRGSNSCED